MLHTVVHNQYKCSNVFNEFPYRCMCNGIVVVEKKTSCNCLAVQYNRRAVLFNRCFSLQFFCYINLAENVFILEMLYLNIFV